MANSLESSLFKFSPDEEDINNLMEKVELSSGSDDTSSDPSYLEESAESDSLDTNYATKKLKLQPEKNLNDIYDQLNNLRVMVSTLNSEMRKIIQYIGPEKLNDSGI